VTARLTHSRGGKVEHQQRRDVRTHARRKSKAVSPSAESIAAKAMRLPVFR